ncbi:MAG: hypothetical protein MJE68_23825 [Proteobacteria bacterium]|nr:hypothetical protein [Pseudomonadota bacterium]
MPNPEAVLKRAKLHHVRLTPQTMRQVGGPLLLPTSSGGPAPSSHQSHTHSLHLLVIDIVGSAHSSHCVPPHLHHPPPSQRKESSLAHRETDGRTIGIVAVQFPVPRVHVYVCVEIKFPPGPLEVIITPSRLYWMHS